MKTGIRSWLVAAGVAFAQAPALPPPAAMKINFEQHVQPVLEAKCYACHGAGKQLAGLRLDRRQLALRGGDYGKVIEPGDSANSKLIHRLVGSQAGMQMPPAGPLDPNEISILRAWIDQGPDYGNSQLAPLARAVKPVSPAFVALLEAITANDLPRVRGELAKSRELANAVDASGSTALIHAAGRGSVAAMAMLITAGADVNVRNRRGATALTWALSDPAKVRLLVEKGAAVDGKTSEGRVPLHIAAQQSAAPEVLEVLLANGANPNAADAAGMTPLHVAATNGNEVLLRALIAAGGNVNAVSGNGSTPLILAAGSGANGAVRLLLESGADASRVTKRNLSALASASYWGDIATMEKLIEKGAPVHLADHDGFAPLTYAAYSEVAGAEAVRLLLRHGARPVPTVDGQTPTSLAARRGALDVVKILATPPAAAPRLTSAILRAFQPLQQQSPNFVKIGGCNSCHNQDLPVFAQFVARQRGIAVPGEFALVPESQNAERVFEHSGLLGASSIGYEVMRRVAKQVPADATSDAMVNYLMAHQEADGHWASRSNRQPLAAGDHHATAFAIFVLRSYGRGARAAEANASVARAVAWLEEHGPVSGQDAAMRLMGMVWGGADSAAVASAADAVSKRQRADGGWSQLPTLPPDAYATGQSLYALALAGVPASGDLYRNGIAYLLRTQAADGTWHVAARSKPLQPYFESGFPYGHDQWISAAGTSWSVMALSMAVEAPSRTASR